MASILKVGDSWRALIRRKGHRPLCKTFSTKARADIWARKTEAAIEAGLPVFDRDYTIGELISQYRELREAARPINESGNEHYMLRHLETDIGHIVAGKLAIDDLIAWAKYRRDQGAGRYTVSMELSKLGTALKYASAALRITLPDVLKQSGALLNHLGLIGAGAERARRPTSDELARILGALKAPYSDIVRFAVATAMRRGEIVRIAWEDVDRDKVLITIRDRKDPRQKAGNDQAIPLLSDALEIIDRQPKTDGRIFPVSGESISDVFKAACEKLEIEDLHFHDLRHHAISLLFEHGYEIQQVALVSGHKDWRHLRRYTNLKPEDLHR